MESAPSRFSLSGLAIDYWRLSASAMPPKHTPSLPLSCDSGISGQEFRPDLHQNLGVRSWFIYHHNKHLGKSPNKRSRCLTRSLHWRARCHCYFILDVIGATRVGVRTNFLHKHLL